MPQTPNWKLAQNMKVYQVSSPSEVVLPRPQTPKDEPEAIFRGRPDILAVVKRLRIDLKLGLPSRFGPISSLEFEK